MRLDKYLVEEGYFESRNRAHEAIKSGHVSVNGKKAKPSLPIDDKSLVIVKDAKFYVSRAARKLEAFLNDYPVEIKGKNVLDIGSSTGGFAQILLERGAGTLHCVDVGREQMHVSLREDDRVALFEETDIRDFESEEAFDLVSCDVSFISIMQILQDIDKLAWSGADLILLYKPQFEVGREVRRDSRGVVQDRDAIARKREEFESAAAELGWELKKCVLSKVQGKEGNIEYFYHFIKKAGSEN